MCLKLVKVVDLTLTTCSFTGSQNRSERCRLQASVGLKIEETCLNLFHVNVSESDCSEVETETSKVKKQQHVNRVDDADSDLIIVEDITVHSTS